MKESMPDAMDLAVLKVIALFKSEGNTMLAYSREGGYVYGCKREDIPTGSTDNNTEIDSAEAQKWVRESLEKGHAYGDIQPPTKKE